MKLTKKTLSGLEDATGRTYSAPLFILDSERPGPIVFMPASVHGAEVQGNAVLWEIMNHASKNAFQGQLWLLPLANPRGTSQKIGTSTYGRFNPVTGHNWNRNYVDPLKLTTEFDLKTFAQTLASKSPQEQRALFSAQLVELLEGEQARRQEYGPSENGALNLELQKLAAKADIVLDLHTGPTATEYVYAPEYLEQQVLDLSFPHHLIIPHEFAGALDEATFMPWVALAKELNTQPQIEVYTVELGSEEVINQKLAHSQALRLISFLAKRGVFKKDPNPTCPKQYSAPLSQFKTYYAPRGGLTEYVIAPGTHFKAGDLLARQLSFQKLETPEEIDHCWSEIRAHKSGILINHYPSAVIGQGHEMLQVLEEPKSVV